MYRYSIGDIDIGRAAALDPSANIAYWIIYLLTIFMLTIIFLNFIIAEASASYSKVSENIDRIMKFEKVKLIVEADTLLFKAFKNDKRYPKFLLVREKEDWPNHQINIQLHHNLNKYSVVKYYHIIINLIIIIFIL